MSAFAAKNVSESGSCDEQALLLAACSAALITLVPVALHQLGAISHLPDPAGGWFDSDRITESGMAHPLGVPDSLPGIASYGTTLALIVLARRSGAARRMLGGKLLVDGGAGAFNVVRQVVRFGKLCSWCTGTALATAVMVYAGRGAIVGSACAVLGRGKDDKPRGERALSSVHG